MNIDIKGVNSVLLIVIIVLVLYCLLRKELFTTSPAVPTTICKNSNENNTYHPKSTPKPNTDNCMYIGNNKYSCKVDGAPLASNSGDDNLAHSAVLGYLIGKSGANIEEMDTFDGSNMCKLCSSIPNKACLPTGMTCGNIDAKLNELYGRDADKQDKQDELETKKNELIRKSKNFANENNSMSDKYKYLVGACDSYCNLFNNE